MTRQQLETYYKGKKVFITGHTGFKGGWLTALLHTLGATVKGYALEPEYEEGVFPLIERYTSCTSVIADIRDKEKLSRAILSFQPDYIFHLASQPLVRRSYEIPAETFEINVAGTANLLESLKSLPNKCAAVIVTTDKVYANNKQQLPYSENDELGGNDPYSASKVCMEIIVHSFRNSFLRIEHYPMHQKAIASARAGNVLGGGDWSRDRIMPDIIRSLQQGTPIPIRNTQSVRPWQHVLEPLAGYLALGAALQNNPQYHSRPYNFGPNISDHIHTQRLTELAIEAWGYGSWEHAHEPSATPNEAKILQLDSSRARQALPWSTKLSAADTIAWTVGWYKKQTNRKADYTFQQIQDFLAL